MTINIKCRALILTCLPFTVMAHESTSDGINLFEGAEITVYDKDGDIVEYHSPLEKFDIGSGVNIPSLGYIKVGKDFYYGGGKMTFYASVSKGKVQDCFLGMKSTWTPLVEYYLNNFTNTSGDWYGNTVKSSGGTAGYYNACIYNGNSAMITIDSLTAL